MRKFSIPSGAMTALVTPFNDQGRVDWVTFTKLMEFQKSQGIAGVVPAGTTGESSTLDPEEHARLITASIHRAKILDMFVMPGAGSNCTAEALHYVQLVVDHGGKAVLLVDPYYNGPSSLEIRENYYAVIAKAFPEIAIVPYVIPGRTGCALIPEDLSDLVRKFPNICAVKEATGDFDRMALTRLLVGPEFQIISGDDDNTYSMMDPPIRAIGVISVISNIAPWAVQEMCQAILKHDETVARNLRRKLDPLFKLVTVYANRSEPFLDSAGQRRQIKDKFRNPLPVKTMMAGLGMIDGLCRQPLGKMTADGVNQVRTALLTVWRASPEILLPIQDSFSVDIEARLHYEKVWDELTFKG